MRGRNGNKIGFVVGLLGIYMIILSAFFTNQVFNTNDLNNIQSNLLENNLSINQEEGIENITQIQQAGDIKPPSQDFFNQVGQSLNLTHYAFREDKNIPFSFTNGSSDSYNVPQGENWEAYFLSADIDYLADQRNWVNGSFNYDHLNDGTYNKNENDTLDIVNPFLNWSFSKVEGGSYTNTMSGNYMGSTSIAGKNALELRMDGGNYGADKFWYDQNEYCQWKSSNIYIPRGNLIDATLKFQVNPYHVIDNENWFRLQVLINNKKVFSILNENLDNLPKVSGWVSFEIAMKDWMNSTNVFNTDLQDSPLNIVLRWDYPYSSGYWSGYPTADYQQIFVANVELIMESEVKAEQIGLKMNGQSVYSTDYGMGTITESNNWVSNEIELSFSSVNNASYSVELEADISVNSTKINPTTCFEPNTDSLGTQITYVNESTINWDFYTYFSVPSGYTETELILFIPGDWNMTWVSTPQLFSINQINWGNRTFDMFKIPINLITENPDGFWHFSASSPNYISNLSIYKNNTILLSPEDWTMNSTFFAGDWINITTTLQNALNFTNLPQSSAKLEIYFPNSSLWISDIAQPDIDGIVRFNPIEIPSSGFNYESGIYNISVSWNNTYGERIYNETGLICSTLTIKHYSTLVAQSNNIGPLYSTDITPIWVNFYDESSLKAIQNAVISFINLTGGIQVMSEPSPGLYFGEITVPTTELTPGENIVTISAAHAFYESNIEEITLNIILDTNLKLNQTIISANNEENYTISLNFTEYQSGNPICDAKIYCNWPDEWSFSELGDGQYKIEFQITGKAINQIYNVELTVEKECYVNKTKYLDIQIVAREINYKIFMNGIESTLTKSISVQHDTILNLTLQYFDKLNGSVIKSANIELLGISSSIYSKSNILGESEILIDTNPFSLGTSYIPILINCPNYQNLSTLIEITVEQIKTKISTNQENNIFDLVEKTNFLLEVEVKGQIDENGITGCEVRINGSLGDLDLVEIGNGVYSISFKDLKPGVYLINVIVYKGPLYEFLPLEITINVKPQGGGIPVWVGYVLGVLIAGVITQIIAYKTYYQYPKMVRDLKGIRKSVLKGSVRIGNHKTISDLYLDRYLEPLTEFLSKSDLTDLKKKMKMNKPKWGGKND